jgi:hypothetical protein
MRTLALCVIWWILIATGNSQTELSSADLDPRFWTEAEDPTLFDNVPDNVDSDLWVDASADPPLFNPQPSDGDGLSVFVDGVESLDSSWVLGDSVGLDSTTELDSHWVLADNVGLDSTNELDLNSLVANTNVHPDSMNDLDLTSLLAGEVACDVTDAGNAPLFGKKRRQTSFCPATPPAGQAESPNEGQGEEPSDPDQDEAGDLSGVTLTEKLGIWFPENNQLCPPVIFGDAIIPVCKDMFTRGQVLRERGHSWAHLLDALPRTSPNPYHLLLVTNIERSG